MKRGAGNPERRKFALHLGALPAFFRSAVKTLDYKRGTGLTPADFDAITIALGVTANGRGKSTNAGQRMRFAEYPVTRWHMQQKDRGGACN